MVGFPLLPWEVGGGLAARSPLGTGEKHLTGFPLLHTPLVSLKLQEPPRPWDVLQPCSVLSPPLACLGCQPGR